MLRRKDVNMLEGSIVKGLLAIAIPIMVMNVLSSLFNLVDTRMLKTFENELAAGAVSASGSLITFISNLVVGIATGANVAVAKRIGRKEVKDAEKAAGTAIAFALAASLALVVIGVTFAESFLDMMNCKQALKDLGAVMYFRLYFVGIPMLMMYNFCSAILRSTGNSRRIMLIAIVAGAVKVVATYLFVGVCRLGVLGASCANFVAWMVYLGMGIWSLTQKDTTVKLRLKYIRFDKNELKPILRVGVPSALQMGMYSIANVMISSTVNAVGAQATTGVGIANIFDGILYNICYATSLAVLPYVSQNIGAGNVKRAAQSVWRGVLITLCIGTFFGALSAIFSRQLASFMADSEEIIWFARQKMIIISSTYFICGINDIICAAMRGLGKPTIPTVVSLFCLCGLRFAWVFFVYPLMPGDNLTFLYLVWPIGWLLSIFVLLPFYFARIKKLKAEHLPNPAIKA